MLAGQPLPLHRLPLHRRGHRGGRPGRSSRLTPRTRMRRDAYARSPRRRDPARVPARRRARRARPGPELARGERLGRQLEGHGGAGRSAKAFTAKTGMPVEFEVGGTIDRLAKARVAKGNPLVDLNFTTTPRGAALHLRRALREARHGQAPQREGDRARGHPQRVPPGHLGLRLHRRVPAGPGEGGDHEVVGSLEALAQGQDRDARLRPLAHHHDRRPDGGRQRDRPGRRARSRLKAAQAEHRGLLLHRRPEPGPDEDRARRRCR